MFSPNEKPKQNLTTLIGSWHSLSVRIVVVTLCYSLVIAIIVSSLQIYISHKQAIENASEQLKQIETGFLPDLTAGMWAADDERIDALLNGISHLPHVGRVTLIDEENHKWERNNNIDNSAIAQQTFTIVYHENDFSYGLGALTVELSDQDIIATLRDRSTSIAITTLVTLLLGSLIVLVIFQRWVSRHLETMAQFAEELDLQHLDRELVLDRKRNKVPDELDIVVASINRMQFTLQEDLAKRQLIEQELVAHKENLEELIKARTDELVLKNELLEEQSLELEAKNRELDAYAHSVAHDLKTPLTTILGVSSLLKSAADRFSPEQRNQSLDIVHRTVKKMSSIIDALLLLASVRRTEDINPQLIDMKTLAEEACLRLDALAQQHKATITYRGNWPKAFGYAQWVEEVWVNYISNAIKYGGTPPYIEIGCEQFNSHYVKCWVRDYGCGIAPERRSELFVQFSRLDAHLSDGHGLGLSIVKRIIRRLNGDVGYEEAEGGGGIFWFTLPKEM